MHNWHRLVQIISTSQYPEATYPRKKLRQPRIMYAFFPIRTGHREMNRQGTRAVRALSGFRSGSESGPLNETAAPGGHGFGYGD